MMTERSVIVKSTADLLEDKTALLSLIDRLISIILNETRPREPGQSKFHCRKKPTVSFTQFLLRVSKFSHCSNAVYVAALIYIDRLQERMQGLFINDYCIHRLFICCIMVGAKYHDDVFYKNSYYAKIGGIPLSDINASEVEMLIQLNFQLDISQQEFQAYLDKLESYRQA